MSVTVATGNQTGLPTGTAIAADTINGTGGTPPASGNIMQYVKLDLGAAGASSPVSSTVPVVDAGIGADITTPTAMPAGGSGVRGWLSAIWTKLNASLAVTGTFWQTTQPVSLASMPTTAVTGTFFQATQPVSLATIPALVAGSAVIGHVIVDTAPTTAVTSAGLTNLDVALSTRLKPADTLAGVTAVGSITSALPAGTNLIGLVQPKAADNVVTTLSSAASTVTLTIPSAGVGVFHYITRIEIVRVSTAAVTGSAVLGYTSTNLPGSWARSAGNAIAIGATVKDVDEFLASPLKSSASNVATTIIAPSGGAGVQVRITVYYYTAA